MARACALPFLKAWGTNGGYFIGNLLALCRRWHQYSIELPDWAGFFVTTTSSSDLLLEAKGNTEAAGRRSYSGSIRVKAYDCGSAIRARELPALRDACYCDFWQHNLCVASPLSAWRRPFALTPLPGSTSILGDMHRSDVIYSAHNSSTVHASRLQLGRVPRKAARNPTRQLLAWLAAQARRSD
eukprot:6111395-Pleurochrysis_carterae.AAC.2